MRTLFPHGHSLIELLIAMTAGFIVLAAAIGGVSHLREGLAKQHDASARQQDVRIGLAVMASELRLAGIGLQLVGRPLLTATADEISFYANLSGRSTNLTQDLAPQDDVMHVRHGAGWRKGKRVVVCDRSQCFQGRLARDGQAGALSLTRPLRRGFASGSQVLMANLVRYYLREDGAGRSRLMRMVDSGASTLMDSVAALRFTFFDRDGHPADSDATIARIRIELTVGDHGRPISQDVALGT